VHWKAKMHMEDLIFSIDIGFYQDKMEHNIGGPESKEK
jgi:hypothetical protein